MSLEQRVRESKGYVIIEVGNVTIRSILSSKEGFIPLNENLVLQYHISDEHSLVLEDVEVGDQCYAHDDELGVIFISNHYEGDLLLDYVEVVTELYNCYRPLEEIIHALSQ